MAKQANRTYEGVTFHLTHIGWKTDIQDFGDIRCVLDQSTGIVWFVGNEGDIVSKTANNTEMVNFGRLGKFIPDGPLSDNTSKWDENDEWDKLEQSDLSDEAHITDYHVKCAKVILIAHYLFKLGESGHKAQKWANLLEAYNAGKLTIPDLSVQALNLQ